MYPKAGSVLKQTLALIRLALRWYVTRVYPSASGRHRTVCSEGLREPLHFNRIFHIFGKADAECVFVSIVTMYARP